MVGKRIEQVAKRVSRGVPFRLLAFLAAHLCSGRRKNAVISYGIL